MNRQEFAAVMAYLSLATKQPFPREAMEVYWDLLGDLPLEVLQIAAKRVALEHPWPSFPSVAELREAAAETMRGKVSEMSAAEAWRLAWQAVGVIDLEVDGSLKRATERLPALVLEAMKVFGIAALVGGKEPVGVVRAQFTKIFDQLQAREKRLALLPAPLKTAIASLGAMPAAIEDKSGG